MRDRMKQHLGFALALCLGVGVLSSAPFAQQAVKAAASPGVPSAADQAFMAEMTQMHQAMDNAPMSGNADQDFVTMMIPHHQGAIAMARTELQYGHDPMLRRMARDIIASQQKEVGEMQAWQARHQGK